jgi:CysZ protein
VFTPMVRAIGQLDDPALLRVLLQTLVISVLCFAGVAGGCFWLVDHVLASAGAMHGLAGVVGGRIAGLLIWLAGALGSVLALTSALWLFLPVAVVIASLFLEPVCRAVERRWYPALPPPSGAGMAAQIWEGVLIGLGVLALSVVSLVASIFLPGFGHVLGWAITAWALGRGLFTAVAMRRMDRRAALDAYRRRKLGVLVQGGLLTVAGTLPLLNFLLPVLGSACMVHVLMENGRARESWG